jgi:hypothetical protein
MGSITLGQAISNLSTALGQMSQFHVIHPQMRPLIEEFLTHPEETLLAIPPTHQADAGTIEFYAVALRCRNQLQGRPLPLFGGNPVITTTTMTLEWSLYQLLRRIGSPRVAGITLDYGQRFSQLLQPLSGVMTSPPEVTEMSPLTQSEETHN